MKRLIFDEDHDMFRDATRRFMQAEIEPHVERWREQGLCDKEAFLKAGEQGLLGMTLQHTASQLPPDTHTALSSIND